MGKVFGISDLPVSTIMSPFEPIKLPKPAVKKIEKFGNFIKSKDYYISNASHKNRK